MTTEGKNPDGTAPGTEPAEPVKTDATGVDLPVAVPADSPDQATDADGLAPEDERAFLEETVPPDKAEDYDLNRIKILDSEDPDEFREALGQVGVLAHRVGLNQAEVHEIAGVYNSAMADSDFFTEEAQAQRYEDGAAALKMIWGDDWEENLAVANAMIENDPEAQAFLKNSGLGNDARLIRAVYAAAQRYEKDFNSAARARLGGPPAPAAGSIQEAQAEIARITAAAVADPKHPYNDRRHPQHGAVAERVMQLHEIANPGYVDPI